MRVLPNLADGSRDFFQVHDLLGFGGDLWCPSLRPPPGGEKPEESDTFFGPGAQKGGSTQLLLVSDAVVVPQLVSQVHNGVCQGEVMGSRSDLAAMCLLPLPAGKRLGRAAVT